MKLFVEVDINNFLQSVEDLWIMSNGEKLKKTEDNLLIYKEGYRFPIEGKEYRLAHYVLESNDKLKTFYSKNKELPYYFSGGFLELVLMYHYWLNLDTEWVYQEEYGIDLREVKDIDGLIKTYIKQSFKDCYVEDVFRIVQSCFNFLRSILDQFGDSLIRYDLEREKVRLIESTNHYENYLKRFGRKEDG